MPRDISEEARLLAESPDAAERAAYRAVQLAFLHLGVDITDRVQVREFRERQAFLARMERGAREIKSAAVKTCVGALVTGLISIVILGFKDTIGSWFAK